jgi:hypothetical protein
MAALNKIYDKEADLVPKVANAWKAGDIRRALLGMLKMERLQKEARSIEEPPKRRPAKRARKPKS